MAFQQFGKYLNLKKFEANESRLKQGVSGAQNLKTIYYQDLFDFADIFDKFMKKAATVCKYGFTEPLK